MYLPVEMLNLAFTNAPYPHFIEVCLDDQAYKLHLIFSVTVFMVKNDILANVLNSFVKIWDFHVMSDENVLWCIFYP